jgi:hypothetical protein
VNMSVAANGKQAMKKLAREDLFSLERYAELRPQFRAQVMAHKKTRTVAVGPHVTLYFEDRLTMQYQVQEMLRVERIFEAAGINDELAAYNPLIPDGSNWKATLMVEYPDIDERRDALVRLRGIERSTWVRVDGFPRVLAVADEDLDREDASKTSSVHFLRFELTPEMAGAVRKGAAISAGVDHADYRYETGPLPAAVRTSLAHDLSP